MWEGASPGAAPTCGPCSLARTEDAQHPRILSLRKHTEGLGSGEPGGGSPLLSVNPPPPPPALPANGDGGLGTHGSLWKLLEAERQPPHAGRRLRRVLAGFTFTASITFKGRGDPFGSETLPPPRAALGGGVPASRPRCGGDSCSV